MNFSWKSWNWVPDYNLVQSSWLFVQLQVLGIPRFFLQTKEMGTVPDTGSEFSFFKTWKWVPDQNHKHCRETEMGTGSEP